MQMYVLIYIIYDTVSLVCVLLVFSKGLVLRIYVFAKSNFVGLMPVKHLVIA